MKRIKNPLTQKAVLAARDSDRATRRALAEIHASKIDNLVHENKGAILSYVAGPTGDSERDSATVRQAVWVQAQAVYAGKREFVRRYDHLRNTCDSVRGLVPENIYGTFSEGSPEAYVQELDSERRDSGSHWFPAGSFVAVPLEPSKPSQWFGHAATAIYRPGLEHRPVGKAIVLTPDWWDVLKAGDPNLIEKPVNDLVENFVGMD